MINKVIPIIALSLLPLAAPAKAAVLQRSQPTAFGSGEPIEDSTASLTRLTDAIEISFETQSLPAGTHTLWWILFGQPEFCTDGCGTDDLSNEAVEASSLFGTGIIVGEDGVGHFEARLEVGELPQGEDQVLRGDGLKDPFGTEVHALTRWHGPASDDPDLLEKQISTFNGGCATPEEPDLFPCANLQATVFPATSEPEAVPEPSSILGFLALVTVGAGSALKHGIVNFNNCRERL
ncbi:MAG: PEP-CTERM sorting domain-containing protein [Cyanobacteria bacterium P01_A01_bin.123]